MASSKSVLCLVLEKEFDKEMNKSMTAFERSGMENYLLKERHDKREEVDFTVQRSVKMAGQYACDKSAWQYTIQLKW